MKQAIAGISFTMQKINKGLCKLITKAVGKGWRPCAGRHKLLLITTAACYQHACSKHAIIYSPYSGIPAPKHLPGHQHRLCRLLGFLTTIPVRIFCRLVKTQCHRRGEHW